MRRRTALGGIATGALAAVAGCLDRFENGDDATPTATPPGGPDQTVVAYDELSADGQAFIEAARDRHEVTWIGDGDGNRVFIELDEDDRYVAVDDPLYPGDLDDELGDIIYDSALLEDDGGYYEVFKDIGHDIYGWDLGLETAEDCEDDDRVAYDELTDFEQTFVDAAIDDSPASVIAEPYTQVVDTDVPMGDDDGLETLDGAYAEDACIEVDGADYRLVIAHEYQVDLAGYSVEPAG